MAEKNAVVARAEEFEPTGQRQITLPPFFTRFVPQWATPMWAEAARWRYLVRNQPLCVICRDTLISYLLGTPWMISARNPLDRNKYREEIDYHVDLFNHLNGSSFEIHLDLLLQDLLDTPFGGAGEVGRLGDVHDAKVVWVQNIDSATLFPTLDYDFPVGQRVPGIPTGKAVYFPRHAINRAYYTPRPEFDKIGWGMAPPEKIYLAVELLFRGDRYYANLLLDTPEAGVLDLLDMSKDTAFEWLESFKTLFQGADPFKVPILYEHTEAAQWIPFGRPPTELIFDSVTFKYAQIVTAGYGLKVADIGLAKEAGKSLAGVIHSERQTRRTGFAAIKTKTKAYFDRLLPPYLEFGWIDQDDEAMIAKGRARLANAQAYKTLREAGLLKLQELRSQIAADGLYNIQIDPDDLTGLDQGPVSGPSVREKDFLRTKTPPSKGGEGETVIERKSASKLIGEAFDALDERSTSPRLRRIIKLITKAMYPSVVKSLKATDEEELPIWAETMSGLAFDESRYSELTPATRAAIQGRRSAFQRTLEDDRWWSVRGLVDEKMLSEALISSFEEGISAAEYSVHKSAYENGLSDEMPVDEGEVFGLKDEALRSEILASGSSLISEIDARSKDLITKIAMASICYTLASPSVFKAIKSGVKPDALLADDSYIDIVASKLAEGLKELLEVRKAQIDDSLASKTWENGVHEFFKRNSIGKEAYQVDSGAIRVDTSVIEPLFEASVPNFWAGG